LLKKENPDAKVTAFTLSFPTENGEESAYDEGPIAKRSADAVGADMKVLCPSEQDLIEAFERGIWHSELALSDLGGAAKHLLSALVQKEGYRVRFSPELCSADRRHC
jgi:asparagine synthase (glutamine-hydrolysing)